MGGTISFKVLAAGRRSLQRETVRLTLLRLRRRVRCPQPPAGRRTAFTPPGGFLGTGDPGGSGTLVRRWRHGGGRNIEVWCVAAIGFGNRAIWRADDPDGRARDH